MVSNLTDKDSIRSISPIIIDDEYRKNSFLLSCCGCSRKRKNIPPLSGTVEETKYDVQKKGFFKRIQFFKAQKRQSSVRKQQLALAVSNGHLIIETDRLLDDHNERHSSITSPSPTILTKYTHQSIPNLNQKDPIRNLNNGIDSFSFNDIEIASSGNERKANATPKSFVSHNLSYATTNLSAYSTQSLLRKLRDKAQILDEYYKDISTKPRKVPSSSLCSSSNSLLERSNTKSRSFIRHNQSPRKKYRQFYDNISSDSSRFNLYADEDNILRELICFNNDIDLILSRLEMEGENLQSQQTTNQPLLDENLIQQTTDIIPQIIEQEEIDQTVLIMRPDINEINIHLLLSNDINRLRETALSKLLEMTQEYCNSDNLHHYITITLNKLNKLPKSPTWKGKRVFGVPLRIYQQTTGHILPIGIINALQYVRMYAGKCDGLFRKPGVKSKIDRLRAQIETTDSLFETIKFDDYQPFVVADVIRQYFRELPECLIPPLITRLVCDLFKYVTQEEQLLAIRYIFLLLPDETREVLETILRFLLDVSARLGNNQTTCRSLARIFLPSVFQSYYNIQQTSSKSLWRKWKKEKSDGIQQENERLILEHCLMTMILNVDLLCRVPSALSDELKLPSVKKTKRLDELVRDECHGDFQLKKYISKKTEQFLQRLSTIKFKNVQTTIDDVNVSVHKPSDSEKNNLPIWKCSIDIPNTNIKQVHQKILHERYLWDNYFDESRTIEKIDNDKEIMQYVLNFHDLASVRSFCEFRFSKKITSRSEPETNSILISSVSIDHLQNHFLPGSIGITYDMHYHIKPSTTHPNHTTVTQIACVDYSGRSTQWYENVYGSLLAHNLISLRDTCTNAKVIRV